MLRLFLLLTLFLSTAAYPQGNSGSAAPPRGSPPVTFNAAEHGALCDGLTDASAAINATLDAIRSISSVPGQLGWMIGRPARFVPGSRLCLIRHPINLTGLYGSGFVADFRGSVIICLTAGQPCVDATGLGQATILGLSIYAPNIAPPNIGLALGRITNDGVGADHNIIDHPTISGFFSLAAYYNNQSETTLVSSAEFSNAAPNAYGAIWDGENHFNVQSALTGKTYPQDQPFSFNENTCVECIITTFGSGDVPIWIGGANRHKFVNSYVAANYSGSSVPTPEVILYSGPGMQNGLLDLDIHFEDGSLTGFRNVTSLVQFQGAASVTQRGLRMRDNAAQQSGPIFSRGSGVTSVTISDAHLEFISLMGTTPSWWDTPAAYTVSGYIYDFDGSYTPPGAFTGMLCGPTSCAVH